MSWQNGPLPPNTYNWGGVVPKGVTGGFLFADFCGDHVKVADSSGNYTKRVEAADVEWYNNHLELPPCCKKVGKRMNSVPDGT